jgi:hypothetical protein
VLLSPHNFTSVVILKKNSIGTNCLTYSYR